MKTVSAASRDREVHFITWLVAVDACALEGTLGHRCKGKRHAVSWPAAEGHVLLCARALDDLHAREGVFAGWTDERVGDLFEAYVVTALARCETAQLEDLVRRAA